MKELVEVLDNLIGEECECDNTHQQNNTECRYCLGHRVLQKYKNQQMKQEMKVETPKGTIEAKGSQYSKDDPDGYPGIWIEINGDGAVLVEHDPHRNCHVIRVYSQDQEEPVYVQEVIESQSLG